MPTKGRTSQGEKDYRGQVVTMLMGRPEMTPSRKEEILAALPCTMSHSDAVGAQAIINSADAAFRKADQIKALFRSGKCPH